MQQDSIEQYRAAWKKKFEEREAEAVARKARLRRLAGTCAQMLKTVYGATRVILIGSIVDDWKLHPDPDIDLVVEGLDAARYFKAIQSLHEVAISEGITGVEFDLITLEDAPESLKQVADKHGVVL